MLAAAAPRRMTVLLLRRLTVLRPLSLWTRRAWLSRSPLPGKLVVTSTLLLSVRRVLWYGPEGLSVTTN